MLSSFVNRSSPLVALVSRHGNKGVVARAAPSMILLNNRNKKEEDKKEYREIHYTTRNKADVAFESTTATPEVAKSKSFSLADRFAVTAEVTVSKIFPGGFGWQTSSLMAGNWGYETDTLNFAMSTGMGDAIGVLGGHMAYYSAKKAALGADIDLTKELHTAILLGSAAFCSGTAWQPIVNVLQGANLPFNQVFMGTWAGCSMAFFVGLRVCRTILSGPLKHIDEPTYENSKNDVSLSCAIGGATGFFVGTDAVYLPEQNWLIGAVGIQPGTPDVVACTIAGTSTSMGFVAAQSTLNAINPAGKCWND